MNATSSPRPKLIFVPEDTQPTIATEGNRYAIAYLELQDDGSEHYYGTLFTASEDMLAALDKAVAALNTAPRFKVPGLGTDSYAIAAICDQAIAKARGQ